MIRNYNDESGYWASSDLALWWVCLWKPNCWRVLFRDVAGFRGAETFAVIDDFGNLVEVIR